MILYLSCVIIDGGVVVVINVIAFVYVAVTFRIRYSTAIGFQ